MDVKIKTENQNFKFRVNILILHNNKILLEELNNNGFLSLPGGHVQLGESTREAAVREATEEVGLLSENQKLIAIIENFFKSKNGENFHELSFYYLMEMKDVPDEKSRDYIYIENDEGKLVHHDFRWINIEKANDYDIRPTPLKSILKDKKFEFSHYVVKNKS